MILNVIKNSIGLIPAAGFANRISPIPCSKEIFPIGYNVDTKKGLQYPEVASASLLKKFKNIGLENIYLVIRKGKWDIPEYFGTGRMYDLNFSYIVTDATNGTPFSINKAFHFVKDKYVFFGFPDILISHNNPYEQMVNEQHKTRADVVLGLFKTNNPQKVDMVDTIKSGLVKSIQIKPIHSDLIFTWLLAIWSPVFTQFLYDFLSNQKYVAMDISDKELYIGHVFQAAIKSGLKIQSITFPDATYIDIGTIGDLKNAIQLNL